MAQLRRTWALIGVALLVAFLLIGSAVYLFLQPAAQDHSTLESKEPNHQSDGLRAAPSSDIRASMVHLPATNTAVPPTSQPVSAVASSVAITDISVASTRTVPPLISDEKQAVEPSQAPPVEAIPSSSESSSTPSDLSLGSSSSSTTTTTTTTSTTTTSTTPSPSPTESELPPAPPLVVPQVEPAPDPFSDRTSEELDAWNQFKTAYNRTYNPIESLSRQANFLANLRFIDSFNRRPDTLFKLGVNHFADKSRDEINAELVGPNTSWAQQEAALSAPIPPPMRIVSDNSAPKWADWRRHLPSSVLDQGSCRDSVVFAALGSIEAAKAIASDMPAQQLSPRQVFECLDLERSSSSSPGSTCKGELGMGQLFQVLVNLHSPLLTLDAYQEYLRTTPEPGRRHCGVQSNQEDPDSTPLAKTKLESFSIVHRDNIVEAVTGSGPLVVALDASQSSFHFYKSGLYHDLQCSPESYNHHALLVAYLGAGTEQAAADHFVLRNSFGSSWGESGYMRMLKDDTRNTCLPQHFAVLPLLASQT